MIRFSMGMALALGLALAGCGKDKKGGGGGKCEGTWSHISGLPGFSAAIGGAEYGNETRAIFNIACPNFEAADHDCVTKSKSMDEVRACTGLETHMGKAHDDYEKTKNQKKDKPQ